MRAILAFLVFIVLVSNEVLAKNSSEILITKVKRSDFPKGFLFGAATSAYQVEGAAHKDGRGPSIWDTFSEKHPEKIADGSNGTIAANSYHLYKEDVALLHQIGFNTYRFSISWTRILPRGNLKGGINKAGIDYYNKLINELLSKGITPFVTIFHFDAPQSLEDAYGGFRGEQIVNDFRDYAEVCFKYFGDRVKHWLPINEPLSVVMGYISGALAPGRCSSFTNPKCLGGDGATEPYIVGHNVILAHGAAYKLYTEKYKATQKGVVGVASNSGWYVPYTDTVKDKVAMARHLAFTFDYFLEPYVTGKYPIDMVKHVQGGRLPRFTAEQSEMLKGAYDFVGINYYTSYYVMDAPCSTQNVTFASDVCTSTTGERDGKLLGAQAGSPWLYVYPKGIRDVILYAKYKFQDPIIYITENGYDEVNTGKVVLKDNERINYYAKHLEMVLDAIKVGANVKGYLSWALLDNYEWASGYTVRFGLVFVDYKNECKRHLKNSALWFQKWLNDKKIN